MAEPGADTAEAARRVRSPMSFIGLQIIGLMVVLFLPDVALWLPNLLK